MWNRTWRAASLATAILIVGVGAVAAIADGPDQDVVPRYQEFSDSEGRFANFNIGGPTNTKKNAFFEDLGSNGRRCVTCHQANDAWTVTPAHIQARFDATRGTDPILDQRRVRLPDPGRLDGACAA